VDISARGRHLSLTLFGAQQFRSKVDDEVVGNAATSLYGRIGDEELTNSSYRSFSATTRDELLQLEKGRLLLRHAHYAVPVFGRFPRPAVLMGAKGTQIFGENAYAQDPATAVLAVMRNLPGKTPTIAAVRSDIEGVPREQVEGALGAVQAAHRAGNGSADSYKNFVWNLKRGEVRPRPARRDGSRILSGLERMRD
jgi:DNA helicase HerA-like ATPase